MKQKHSIYFYFWRLGVFLLLAGSIFFRTYLFADLPAILNRDESALAYNALTLKTLGVDEWGRSWPIALESFGDYKLIGYPAILAGLFNFFGIEDWVVRLPSMLAGIGVVLLSFMIGQQFFTRKMNWFFTVLIATAPVFLFYSRSAWEANLALFYLINLIYLLFFYQTEKFSLLKLLLVLFFTSLAVLTYNTPLIILPLLVLPLLFLAPKKHFWSSLLLFGGILLVCLTTYLILKPVFIQKSGITILTDPTTYAQWIDYRQTLSPVLQPIFGNRYLFLSGKVFKSLALSFSPKFLVINGGSHPWHTLPGWGHLYWPVAFFGVVETLFLSGQFLKDSLSLVRKKLQLETFKLKFKKDYLWLYWLLVSLLPAVITVDAPHATRSLLFFWLLTFLAIKGMVSLLGLIDKKWPQKWRSEPAAGLILSLTAASFIQYSWQYFRNYPTQSAEIFQADFSQVIRQVEKTYPNQPIAIVDSSGYQYILLAWYLRITPKDYLETVVRQKPDNIGLEYGERVGRYHFIAQRNDALEEEKIILSWNVDKKSWLIEEL